MGGGQQQALALMTRLAALGHEQTLLTPGGSPLYEAACAAGLDARPLSVAAVVRFGRDVDVVHAHDASAHSMAAAAGRAPVVVSRRTGGPVRRGPASRWKYRRAAHFIAVSHYVEQRLLDSGILPERISVVYDGVDPGPAEYDPAAPDAVALNGAQTPDGRRIVEEAAQMAGVPVRFSDDLRPALAEARLFVYIAETEGLGLPALVAMANGVPVVASRVGGLPEAVEDGRTGILTSNDPRSVAAAMARLFGNEPLARELSANGRRRIAERFSVESMAAGTLDAYHTALFRAKAAG
jgi:glycosyltransferase involved in cell wall biosynthesis